MKKKNEFRKKLSLDKMVIARMDHGLLQVYGGAVTKTEAGRCISLDCPPPDPSNVETCRSGCCTADICPPTYGCI